MRTAEVRTGVAKQVIQANHPAKRRKTKKRGERCAVGRGRRDSTTPLNSFALSSSGITSFRAWECVALVEDYYHRSKEVKFFLR